MKTVLEALWNKLFVLYSSGGLGWSTIIIELTIAVAVGMYIFFVYRVVSRRSVYIRSFHVSLPMITVITAVIIATLQGSLLVTFGALGALSIVRYRTAIKDPVDLVFIFWSITSGIVCGAGLIKLGLAATVFITALVILLEALPVARSPLYLIVTLEDSEQEEALIAAVKTCARRFNVKSRNINSRGCDIVVEVETKFETELFQTASKVEGVKGLSLINHEGEISF